METQQITIAVLTCNYEKAAKWLIEIYSKVGIDLSWVKSDNIVVGKTGPKFVLVVNSVDASSGWRFSDMMIAPDYKSLESLVRSRTETLTFRSAT